MQEYIDEKRIHVRIGLVPDLWPWLFRKSLWVQPRTHFGIIPVFLVFQSPHHTEVESSPEGNLGLSSIVLSTSTTLLHGKRFFLNSVSSLVTIDHKPAPVPKETFRDAFGIHYTPKIINHH